MSEGAPAAAAAGSGPKPAWVEAKALWRGFEADQERSPTACDVSLGIAATFTAHPLRQFIGARLLSAGIRPHIAVGPYNQLMQACLDPGSHLGPNCDAAVLLWRIEDLMGDELDDFLNGDKAGLGRATDKLSSLIGAIANLRSNFAGAIIVSVPPLPAGAATGPSALDNATRLGAFHRGIVARLVESLERLDHVRLLDLDVVQRSVGFAAAFDSRQWYLFRQPFSDRFLYEAGAQIARIVAAGRRSPKKCIVVDCDGTLWGGVIGEDGLDGIELGDEYPGSAFRDLQRLLLHWRKQGVFLAILSKNNEADVWEAFERHGAMLLERGDISAWQINWLPKADNLALIAKALNIGAESFVFIDDSPMEIAYMQAAHPEVTCIRLPDDPAAFVSSLQDLALFDRLDVTAEDLSRVDMVRAERDRGALDARLTKQEFLSALELKIELSIARADDLGRVTQLINKTNQFNLTTVRRSLEQVRAIAGSPEQRLYALRMRDRFGDYGLTGVVIAEVSADGRVWTIDTLLLSCRVLGRGVETALIAALADDARPQGGVEFLAAFLPTSKNAPAASFLADHGFAPDGERWRLPLARAPALPPFIERLNGIGAARSEQAA